MADRSATYSLEWSGDFTPKATEAAGAANALSKSLVKLEKAAKVGTDAMGGAAKKLGTIAPKADTLKPAAKKTEEFSLKVWAMTKAFGVSEKEAKSFIENGAIPWTQVANAVSGAAVAAAAAVAVLTIAAVAGAVAFIGYALGAANAARAANLLAQAATGSLTGAKDLEKQVAKLGLTTGLSSGKLTELGLGLARAGVQGQFLKNAFSAVAVASSAMGDAAGSKIAGIAEEAVKTKRIVLNRLNLMGTGVGIEDVAMALSKKLKVSFATAKAALQAGTVKVGTALEALDNAVQAKLGGIAKKQAIGLDVQLERLKGNIGKLFAGLDIEPFLEGLHDMLSIFDQSTTSGVGLKAAMQGIAKPLIEGVTAAMPIAKAFFQGMIIAALEVAIVVLKVRNYLRDTFGGSKASVDGFAVAMLAGKVVLVGIAAVIAVIGVSLAAFGATVALVAAPIVGIGAAIYEVVGIVQAAFTTAMDYLEGLDFGAVALGMIDGLVGGILTGTGLVISAVRNLGAGAMAALKGTLGIASPSTVFKGYGLNTAEGFATGVDAGAPAANDSVAEMVAAPRAAGAKGGEGGRKVEINGLTIHIHGVKDAAEITSDSFMTKLAQALEQVAAGSGAPLSSPEAA